MPKKLGTQIKKIRDKNKLSQKRFGQKIGVSAKTISAYETGRITPPYKVLEEISAKYEVPLITFSESHSSELEKKLEKLEMLLSDVKKSIIQEQV